MICVSMNLNFLYGGFEIVAKRGMAWEYFWDIYMLNRERDHHLYNMEENIEYGAKRKG